MGLDTTHDCWHGPYSSFKAFRDAVASAVVPPLSIDWERYPMRCYQGWWDKDFPYTDPLEVFFVHSDCDGYIFPQDASVLAERMEGFIERIADDFWRERARAFIDGLKRAADDWEIVRFH